MDKITRIHLAKIPYEIDIRAQDELKRYLDDIRGELDVDLEEDIMTDIEVRITEILSDRNIKRNDVITAKDIDAIREQLGSPEQFNDSDTKSDKKHPSSIHSKRLLRDYDNAILGGVASGLGAYFDLDPVIFRIAFILSTLFWGFGILIYILLWLLVPVAVSSSDKLQMRGEPVTAATLQRYRNTAEQTITNLRIRSVIVIIFKVFRILFTIWAILFVLAVLSLMGLANAILYTQPLHPLYRAYHLNYILLGLLWLLIMGVIGLTIVLLLRLWQKRTAPLKIAFVTLVGIMVVTVAGIAVVTPFVVNYYKNQYSGNKLAAAVPISTIGKSSPTSLNLSADNNLVVSYVITNQTPHASYQAVPGMGHPKISIVNNKGTFLVQASQLNTVTPSCVLNWCKNLYLPIKVTIYGPTLQKFTADGGAELDLENIDQPSLTLNALNNANLNIDSSYSDNMILSAESGASITSTNTTALSANITVQASSNVIGPTSSTLNVVMPKECDGNILFLAQSPQSVTVNGQQITAQAFSQNSCVNSDNLGPPPAPNDYRHWRNFKSQLVN